MSRFAEQYSKNTTALLNWVLKSAEQDKNIVLSPFSIQILLAILYDATKGDARREIGQFLLPSDEEGIVETFSHTQTELERDGLTIATALCVKAIYADTVNSPYVLHFRERFSSEFFSTKDIESDVNEWVKDKTKGLVEKITDDKTKDAVLCLLNATAFVSDWESEYEEENINYGEFAGLSGEKTKAVMLKSVEHKYIEDALSTGFLRPYKGGKFSFLALLPKKRGKKGLKEVLQKLDMKGLIVNAEACTVFVTMPEFKAEYRGDIDPFCKEQGIQTIYKDVADFSLLSDADLPLERIIHKAYIWVDRRGTRAAAATMAEIGFAGGMNPIFDTKEVILDRPFVYAVVHNHTGLPVFTGVVRRPEVMTSDSMIEERMARMEDWKRREQELIDSGKYSDLKESYRRVAKRLHPDIFDSNQHPELSGCFEKATDAYRFYDLEEMQKIERYVDEVLGDNDSRKAVEMSCKKEKNYSLISQEQMQLIMEDVYEKAIDGISGVSHSVDDMVEDYLKKEGTPARAAKSLIKYQIAKCGTSGFITGLGGMITLPATIPANVGSVLYVQMRMIAAIAKLGGFDIRSDQVRTLIYPEFPIKSGSTESVGSTVAH